jgi:hypothetical protein
MGRYRTILFSFAASTFPFIAISSIQGAAAELTPFEAKTFVVGRWWSYKCYDGTLGYGRALADGSVTGTFQEGGLGTVRKVSFPPGTIKVQTSSICAPRNRLLGIFTPCFIVNKHDAHSFRGSMAPLRWPYCEFVSTNAPNE